LAEISARTRPGTLFGAGKAIEQLATRDFVPPDPMAAAAIQRIQADLTQFASDHQLDRLVVINLASTEPGFVGVLPEKWSDLQALLSRPECNLPASSLYAIAALQCGAAYINFTPSLGSELAAIQELARIRRTCHMGRDGKTGETLMKSALAPVFAARHLRVRSWVGHNIFGNLDGRVLDDPENKKAKVASKDQLLRQILNYDPQTLVSIEYIRSLGDWKTAWDHIHFEGFLSTPMVLQFIWQGCDSLLAAPLVLDLFRFAELALRLKIVGSMPWLACFFKSPSGVGEHNFLVQFQMLEQWTQQCQQTAAAAKRNA
jgi:myo-inositol-1-phosphate synthase